MDENTRTKIRNIMTTERDFMNQLAYARKEGREAGREEGREEGCRTTATRLKELGVALAIISQATGLSEEEIENL